MKWVPHTMRLLIAKIKASGAAALISDEIRQIKPWRELFEVSHALRTPVARLSPSGERVASFLDMMRGARRPLIGVVAVAVGPVFVQTMSGARIVAALSALGGRVGARVEATIHGELYRVEVWEAQRLTRRVPVVTQDEHWVIRHLLSDERVQREMRTSGLLELWFACDGGERGDDERARAASGCGGLAPASGVG